MKSLVNRSNLYLGLFLFFVIAVFFAYYLAIININDGKFIYPLDDAYIHMTIAKNFILNGTWGFMNGVFSSASSSILWTFLLSICFRIFGVSEIIPLVLSLIFSIAFVYSLHILCRFLEFSPNLELILLFVMFFSIPLPLLIFLGMEHSLHCFLLILFILYFLKQQSNKKTLDLLILSLISILIVLTRLEACFTIFIVCLIFIYQKQIKTSLIIGISGMFPIVIQFIINYIKTGIFLPFSINSKLLYGSTPGLKGILKLFIGFIPNIFHYKPIFALCIFLIFALLFNLQKNKFTLSRSQTLLIISLLSLVLHAHFARFAWLYRYEMYLIVISIFALFYSINEFMMNNLKMNKLSKYLLTISIILCLYSAFMFIKRDGDALCDLLYGTNNIYCQQYQNALFLRKYYNHSNVVINDIGVSTLLTNIKILDLYGLVDSDLSKRVRAKNIPLDYIEKLAHEKDMDIALLYPRSPKFPESWEIVCYSIIIANAVCGNDTVFYLSLKKEKTADLYKNLKEFSKTSPANVDFYFSEKIDTMRN